MRHRRILVLLPLAAALLLAGDLLQLTGSTFAWTVVLALAFAVFAGGLVVVLGSAGVRAHPLSVVGAVCGFVGAIAGAAMQVLFRAWSVLDEAGHEEALRLLQNHVGIRLSTLVPGVLFPLGLLLLAAGLYRSRQLRLPTALALAVGAAFFPLGHAAGNPFAMVAGDLVLLAALGALAFELRMDVAGTSGYS